MPEDVDTSASHLELMMTALCNLVTHTLSILPEILSALAHSTSNYIFYFPSITCASSRHTHLVRKTIEI